MPLSSEQRQKLKKFIRNNTFYTDGSYVVHTIEQAIDTPDPVTISDLFMPNDIIKMHDKNDFWLKMVSIICSDDVKGWHEIEYGTHLNESNGRERYIFTWLFQGNTFKFYTKILRNGRYAELIWYISSHKHIDLYMGEESGMETDEDEVLLHS